MEYKLQACGHRAGPDLAAHRAADRRRQHRGCPSRRHRQCPTPPPRRAPLDPHARWGRLPDAAAEAPQQTLERNKRISPP